MHVYIQKYTQHTFASPREVTSLEPQSAELEVSASCTHNVHALHTDSGVGGLAARLEDTLLSVEGTLAASWSALVPGVARNSCIRHTYATHPPVVNYRSAGVVSRWEKGRGA